MVQKTGPQHRKTAKPVVRPAREAQSHNDGLTDELRKELRALIARRAPALRELEKH